MNSEDNTLSIFILIRYLCIPFLVYELSKVFNGTDPIDKIKSDIGFRHRKFNLIKKWIIEKEMEIARLKAETFFTSEIDIIIAINELKLNNIIPLVSKQNYGHYEITNILDNEIERLCAQWHKSSFPNEPIPIIWYSMDYRLCSYAIEEANILCIGGMLYFPYNIDFKKVIIPNIIKTQIEVVIDKFDERYFKKEIEEKMKSTGEKFGNLYLQAFNKIPVDK